VKEVADVVRHSQKVKQTLFELFDFQFHFKHEYIYIYIVKNIVGLP